MFVNNIIVTLPPDVKPLSSNLQTIDASTLTDTAPVVIKLPDRPNSVGIIDGQHRIFAYHETVDDDPDIAQLRVQQNLLVTGIIFPEGVSALNREKFEARLFLEINSTQSKYPPAKPGALGLGPLEAAEGVADAAPRIWSRPRRLVSARGSSARASYLPSLDCECRRGWLPHRARPC